jgi:hypothetical protein
MEIPMIERGLQAVTLKYQLSDWTLFRATLRMQVKAIALMDDLPAQADPDARASDLAAGSDGLLYRGMPLAADLARLERKQDFLRYVPLQYQHCYIDLGMSFDAYKGKFSSKTRSTITRKIKKYAEHCGGEIPWKAYRAPGEMREFFGLAREVSKLTYQERLLDAGLPETEDFIRQAQEQAADDALRAYILLHDGKPVAYLYCPVKDGVVIYAYLGYHPDYAKWSVGTVLQWLALEQLFAEGRFRCFDFTEGQSDHKRLFATHQRHCANVYFVRPTLGNRLLIHFHLWMDQLSAALGNYLERHGLKAKLKRLLRRAG